MPEITFEEQIAICTAFLQTTKKNKLLVKFLKEDIEAIEKITKTKFTDPTEFYEVNTHIKPIYDELLHIKNFKMEREKGTERCEACGSENVIVRYIQVLSGDEVETREVSCRDCGAIRDNM